MVEKEISRVQGQHDSVEQEAGLEGWPLLTSYSESKDIDLLECQLIDRIIRTH